MSRVRLDIRNSDGTVFRDRSIEEIQSMIGIGAVGPRSVARLANSDSEWRSIRALKGLDWSVAPDWSTTAAVLAENTGSNPASSGSRTAVSILGVVAACAVLVTAAVLVLGGRPATEEARETIVGGQRALRQEDGQSRDSSDGHPMDEVETLVRVQARIARDLFEGMQPLLEEIHDGVSSGAIGEAETRKRIVGLLSDGTREEVERFSHSGISSSDRLELERLGNPSEAGGQAAIFEWLVFEVLLALDLVIEVWSEELSLREIDPSLVASIGLIGENTHPEFRKGIQIVRRLDDRLVYRCFGGTLEYRLLDGVNGFRLLGGSAVTIRDAVALQSFEESVRGSRTRTVEEGRGGVLSSLVGDYVERFENQPWATEVIATPGISIANVIVNDGDYGSDGQISGSLASEQGMVGFGAEWIERHHRAVPLMWMVDENESPLGHGTGFVVSLADRWYVVTNRHVIDPAFKSMMVFMSVDDGGRPIDTGPEAYVRLDREVGDFIVHQYGNDLAVVDVTEDRTTLEAAGVVPLTLATPDEVSRGAELVWVGHPTSDNSGSNATSWREQVGIHIDAHRVTRGEAAVLKRELIEYAGMQVGSPWPPFESYAIITTGAIVRGNSGGPMIRASDGAVVGVCTAGRGQEGGERNIGIRGRHVVETIQSGIRFDRTTMSNDPAGEVVERVAGEERASGPNREAVVAACGAIAEWPLTDDEIGWLDWAVTSGEDGGNWSPMTCAVVNLPADKLELDLASWMRREKLDLRSQYFVFASPRSKIDIDLRGLNSLAKVVATDTDQSAFASVRIEGVVGDDGVETLVIDNYDGVATEVLLMFFNPAAVEGFDTLMSVCKSARQWPMTTDEEAKLAWLTNKVDGGRWTPIHCEVMDLPRVGTNLLFEDWVRSQKLDPKDDYFVFVSPRRGHDIDMQGLNGRGEVVIEDRKSEVFAMFRVDSVGGVEGVSTLDVTNHDETDSEILLILFN